jgi:predicted DNA-binding transcriptional regulator YafY
MSRSERLLTVLQILRRHRRPLPAQRIAEETGVSLRTIYRDIDTLRAQGAVIEGEAGLGYILRPGFLLPPLMFSADEIEALVLGARMVSVRADPALARAATEALARLSAVLPPELRDLADSSALLVPPPATPPAPFLADLRIAIRRERKVSITYRDAGGTPSARIIWPFALGFFDTVRMVVAFCETRQAIRHFREDRIETCTPLEARYPTRRAQLLREWRTTDRRAPGDTADTPLQR